MTSDDFGLNFAAGSLDFEAGVVDLCSCAASLNHRTPDPGNSLPAAQQTPDRISLFNRSTRRMEIDRSLPVLHISKETADARSGVLIDIAFNSNPAVTNRSARICRAFCQIEDQARSEPGDFGKRFRTQLSVDQQQGCEQDGTKYHQGSRD